MINVGDYLPLVKKYAGKYKNRYVEYDELYGVGLDALLDAYRNNKNPEKASFGTYATHYIKGAIFSNTRRRQRRAALGESALSSEEVLTETDNKQSLTCSPTISPEEVLGDKEEIEILKDNVQRLSLVDRSIIHYRYYVEPALTYSQIGKKLNIHQKQVSRLEHKILDSLRKSYV